MFEAGYLFKYYSVVWKEFKTPSEDSSEKFHTENMSYKERGKSFKLTARTIANNPNEEEGPSKKKNGCCS